MKETGRQWRGGGIKERQGEEGRHRESQTVGEVMRDRDSHRETGGDRMKGRETAKRGRQVVRER